MNRVPRIIITCATDHGSRGMVTLKKSSEFLKKNLLLIFLS